MKRFISVFLALLISSSALAQNVFTNYTVGQYTTSASNSSSRNNQNTTAGGWSFAVPLTKTLSKIHFRIGTVFGAVTSGDIRWRLMADNGDSPGTVIETSTVTSGSIANNTWVANTGFTSVLSPGTQYWVVIDNADAVPGTNYIAYDRDDLSGTRMCGFFASAFMYKRASDGVTWNTESVQCSFNVVLEFADGSVLGWPFVNVNRGSDSGDGSKDVYSNRETGNLFTTPADASMRVRCVVMPTTSRGTPTGELRYRIYEGGGASPTLLGTTNTATLANIIPGLPLCFTSPVTMNGNTQYRVVASETTQADSSSNVYSPTVWINGVPDAVADDAKPWNGTCQQTTYNGTSWAQDASKCYPMMLILDQGDEFAASGGVAGRSQKIATGFGGL